MFLETSKKYLLFLDVVTRILNVTAPALRAPAWGIQPPPVFENKATIQTSGRLQNKAKGFADALSNMDQVLQDLFDR